MTVKFVVATQGKAVFDSNTAAVSLVNARLARYLKTVGGEITEGFLELEKVTKHQDIYTWND